MIIVVVNSLLININIVNFEYKDSCIVKRNSVIIMYSISCRVMRYRC